MKRPVYKMELSISSIRREGTKKKLELTLEVGKTDALDVAPRLSQSHTPTLPRLALVPLGYEDQVHPPLVGLYTPQEHGEVGGKGESCPNDHESDPLEGFEFPSSCSCSSCMNC